MSTGLFYDGIDNGIGTEMALLEANKLNAAFARAIWEEEKERERLEREKEKEAADKYKAEREKGDESPPKEQGDENKGIYVCVRGCMCVCVGACGAVLDCMLVCIVQGFSILSFTFS